VADRSEPHTPRAPLRRCTTARINTETTGLGPDARIVEVTVLGVDGTIVLNTLVSPDADPSGLIRVRTHNERHQPHEMAYLAQ
jgi:hypothetical protein